MKSSGPIPEPGWEPHPDCSQEGQPCPELQGPWERAQGCHPLEEETCRSRSKRGCTASPGQVPPPDKGHFGQSSPQVVSTLFGAPNPALQRGEMGRTKRRDFQPYRVGPSGQEVPDAALLPGRGSEL